MKEREKKVKSFWAVRIEAEFKLTWCSFLRLPLWAELSVSWREIIILHDREGKC